MRRTIFSLERWRTRFQIGGLLLTNLHFLQAKWLPCPVLNCYACPLASFACPIGSLQFALGVGIFPFYLLGVLFLSGLLFGRFTCGWLCPFGLLQDLLHKIPSPKVKLPRPLSYGKYAFLLTLVLLVPLLLKEPYFCKICPQGTLEAGIPWPIIDKNMRALIGWLYFLKVGILLGVVALSVLIYRPFCRAVCPLGAILSFFNRVSLLRVEVDWKGCRGCGLCASACPQGISIYEEGMHPDCIGCMKCRVCPAIKIGASIPSFPVQRKANQREP